MVIYLTLASLIGAGFYCLKHIHTNSEEAADRSLYFVLVACVLGIIQSFIQG